MREWRVYTSVMEIERKRIENVPATSFPILRPLSSPLAAVRHLQGTGKCAHVNMCVCHCVREDKIHARSIGVVQNEQ